MKNLNLSDNLLAIVNPLKIVIAIKSDEQHANELSLNNVNYLINISLHIR